MVISDEILDEYKRVATILTEEYPPTNLKPFLSFIEQKATFVKARNLPEPVCEDPDDDKFLACAISSDAKIIVSGDKHLLKVSGYCDVQVKKPSVFIREDLA